MDAEETQHNTITHLPYRVSVVIPTYQRCASVQRALRALAGQTLSPDAYEVIVSIDGSEDGTEEMVARFTAPYTLRAIWQPNGGRAAACNAGIAVAMGEIVVLLDDDMEPAPGFLAAHLQAHRSNAALGVMGAVPITFDRSSPPVVQYVGAKFNSHLRRLAQPGHQLKLRDFYSGNFSIRRHILIDVDAFDEAFKIYGNEDLELSLRLLNADVHLIYNREALAHQHYTKNFAALARDNIAKGRTAVLLAQKHPLTLRDLKLSTFRQGSGVWRFVRARLLELSRRWSRTPDRIVRLVTWLEQRQPTRVQFVYALALDYCYWLGATSALHEVGTAHPDLSSVAALVGARRR